MIEWNNLTNEERRQLVGIAMVHIAPNLPRTYAAQLALDIYNEARLIHQQRDRRLPAQMGFDFEEDRG